MTLSRHATGPYQDEWDIAVDLSAAFVMNLATCTGRDSMPAWLALIESIRSGRAARWAIIIWASGRNILSSLKSGTHVGNRFQAGGLVIVAEKMVADTGAAVAAPVSANLWTTGVQALTASEFRVARLAAQPMSNRDIAQALFITTKTVSDHLSSAYRKLKINNCDQLAAATAAPAVRNALNIDVLAVEKPDLASSIGRHRFEPLPRFGGASSPHRSSSSCPHRVPC